MIRIGIIGDFLKTANILSVIFSSEKKDIRIINFNNFDEKIKQTEDFLIIGIAPPNILSSKINNLKLNILIINETDTYSNLSFPPLSLCPNGIILINSDNKSPFKVSKSENSYIITFGYNPKSSVTISSITAGNYNTIQIYIQRNLPTISGSLIEEQEFSINIHSNDIAPVLSAIAAALSADISINTIKSTPI